MSKFKQGEVYRVKDPNEEDGQTQNADYRPAVVIQKNESLRNVKTVTFAWITGREANDYGEVEIKPEHCSGISKTSAVKLHQVFTLGKNNTKIHRNVGRLPKYKMVDIKTAMKNDILDTKNY